MNREIKFRALDLNGNWVYGGITSSLHTPDGKTYIVSNECKEGHEDEEQLIFIEVIPETVGQFTGLKDKNGVEIFEGDTVLAHLRRKELVFTGTIAMPKSCWVLALKNGTGLDMYYRTAQFDELQIIGNIHESEAPNE